MSLGIRCGRVVLGFELLAISRDESCKHNNKREKQASKFQTVVTSGEGGSGHMVYLTVGGVLYVKHCGRCLGVCVFAILYINVEMFVIRQTPVAFVPITCAHRYLHTPSRACVVHTMQRTHTRTLTRTFQRRCCPAPGQFPRPSDSPRCPWDVSGLLSPESGAPQIFRLGSHVGCRPTRTSFVTLLAGEEKAGPMFA